MLMYVCMYACMHVFMRVCTYVCVYACMYACMHVWLWHHVIFICVLSRTMMLIAGITCACKSRQNARGISSEWCITPTIKQNNKKKIKKKKNQKYSAPSGASLLQSSKKGENKIFRKNEKKKRKKKRKNQNYSAPSDASLLQPREKEEEKKQQFQKKIWRWPMPEGAA